MKMEQDNVEMLSMLESHELHHPKTGIFDEVANIVISCCQRTLEKLCSCHSAYVIENQRIDFLVLLQLEYHLGVVLILNY